MSKQLQLAYLTSVYPRASDSFIRGEVMELRALGFEVFTFAVRRPEDSQIVSDELRAERAGTCYLLDSKLLLVWNALLSVVQKPIRFINAAWLLFRTHPPGFLNRLRQIAYVLEAASLARLLESRQVQHVHNHIGENSATVAMLAAELSNVTYSLTIHGPGIFFHPRQWALGEKIERSTFTACITNFCLSQCMIFADHKAWSKLRIVRCGVGDSFLCSPLTEPTPDPHFVCVGRLCAEKGHLVLVEAVKRLRDEGLDIQLNIVGDGELRREIESAITHAHLERHVILHGWASSQQVKEHILRSRAFVLPSFSEGLPVVFMESLALGRPVIAAGVAGIPELIEHGALGWLVKPADVASLCDALRECLQCEPGLLQQMGVAGRAAIESSHNVHREGKKLQALFTAAIQGDPLPSQATLDSLSRAENEELGCQTS